MFCEQRDYAVDIVTLLNYICHGDNVYGYVSGCIVCQCMSVSPRSDGLW